MSDRLIATTLREEREVYEPANEEPRHRGRVSRGWDRSGVEEERRAALASRPRTRRWRDLARLDDQIDGLHQRLDRARHQLAEAEAAAGAAPAADARSLAAWIAAGEKGRRPPATVSERERERDAARLVVEALQIEVDRALEERRQHVERHRARMLKDVQKDVGEASERLAAHIGRLPELREALLAARENLRWIATFPEQAEGFGFPSALALGLREPVKRTLQTTARVEYRSMVAALAEDVTAIAEAHPDSIKAKLGIPVPRTPLKEAMWWDSDPDAQEWKRQELQRARQLAEYHHDPSLLAREVRE